MNSINRLRNTPSGDVPEVVQEANEDTQDSQSERNEVLRRAMERDAFWEAESVKINEEFKDHTFGPSRVEKNITRCFDLSKERIELRQAKENEKTWLFNQRENSSQNLDEIMEALKTNKSNMDEAAEQVQVDITFELQKEAAQERRQQEEEQRTPDSVRCSRRDGAARLSYSPESVESFQERQTRLQGTDRREETRRSRREESSTRRDDRRPVKPRFPPPPPPRRDSSSSDDGPPRRPFKSTNPFSDDQTKKTLSETDQTELDQVMAVLIQAGNPTQEAKKLAKQIVGAKQITMQRIMPLETFLGDQQNQIVQNQAITLVNGIPIFSNNKASGRFEDWMILFNSCIETAEFEEQHKIRILKSRLSGDASKTVQIAFET